MWRRKLGTSHWRTFAPERQSSTRDWQLIDASARERVIVERMDFETQATRFQCAGCGEWNATTVDPSGGSRQSYVEDCQICCKPNLLSVAWTDGEWWVAAELE